MLDASSSRMKMPSSSQIVSTNSTGVNCGLRMTATSACPGMRSSSERTTVVLPVPTSPVSWMNPPASLIP